ncbi:UNVERIFIED_CONTAM: hypothetical protein HDU68_012559 [Siphonaria sp. JEL0065]|nr:hypothetical protein HDU68_012559 [Siphonaria sp. JEL0065]
MMFPTVLAAFLTATAYAADPVPNTSSDCQSLTVAAQLTKDLLQTQCNVATVSPDLASLQCVCAPSHLATLKGLVSQDANACSNNTAASPVDPSLITTTQTLINTVLLPACDSSCQDLFKNYGIVQKSYTSCANTTTDEIAIAKCFCTPDNLLTVQTVSDDLTKCTFLKNWAGASASGLSDASSVLTTISTHCKKDNFTAVATSRASQTASAVAATATATGGDAKSNVRALAAGSVAFVMAMFYVL